MYTLLITALFLLAPAQQDPEQAVPFLSDIPMIGELFVQEGVVPDPDLRWNGTTEDIYRRAMHLIQVRAKYREGAELLLSIADSDQVIQIPGQSSWVLGQAALALAQAGAQSDAEALVPGILNGSRGTDLEPQVDVLLQRLSSQLKQDHQQLDETFRLYIENQLANYPSASVAVAADIIGYGRQALPYLEEITRSQLVLGAAGLPSDINQAKLATYFALRLATEESAMRLYALLQQHPPLTTSVLLSKYSRSYGDDPQAKLANSKFYLKMAQDEDSARAQLAESRLVKLGGRIGGEEVMDYLWNLAQEDDSQRVAELAELVLEGTRSESEEWTAFVTRCAESGHGAVGEAARWGMVGLDHHREDLREIVEQGGGRRDQLRYLACFILQLRPPGENYGRQERTAIVAKASHALDAEGFYRVLGHSWSRITVEPEDYSWIIKLAGSPDPGVAATAFTVALDSNSDEVRKSVFMSAVGESKGLFLDALTYRGRNWGYDAESAQALLAMAAAGSESAHLLLASSGMAYLSVAELVDSGVTWGSSGKGDGWYEFLQARNRRGDTAAIADLVSLAGIEYKTRSLGINWIQADRSASLRAARSVAAWASEDSEKGDYLYRESIGQMLRETQRSDSLPEDLKLGDVEHFIETVWKEIRAGRATVRGSGIIELINRHWVSAPERAYELGLRLLKDEDDLQRYLDKPPAGGADSEWTQRLNYALVQSGVWDLNKREAYWFNREQSEFEPLMRAMFALPNRRVDALDVLARADHKWLDVFATDIDAAWADPELCIVLVRDFYEGNPEIKAQVEHLLAAWELEGVQSRSTLLRGMGETLDERVVPVLLDQLGSANKRCRAAASAGLQRMREVREQREFWEAWEATGSSLSPTVALIQKLKSDKQVVRIAAIQSLGTLKAPEALPFLVELLEDGDAKIRDAAAVALAKINAE